MVAAHPENKIVATTLLAGKYRVTRELGRGGMAAVYEAEHIDLGKRVAIKVLAAELSSSPIVIERFVREARAAASVKSPHIVEVYDSGRLEDGRPFIAMELLEGESLYDRMARIRLLDRASTARIIGQVAKGLTKAHAIGIVHRDLKPENIHLCKAEDGGEIAKILDFGLAKFYAPVEADEKTVRLTREGAVFGTPAYMSPEQVKGQGNVDYRSDLWALGCMAYECLTGRPVWNTDQGVAMTFAAIAASPLPTPSRLRPDLPPAFDPWFFKALERDPARRFQSAKELADELARALETPPISLAAIGGPPSSNDLRKAPSSRPPPFSVPSPTGTFGLRSDPIDLVQARRPALSVTDLPPTAGPEAPPSLGRRRRSGVVPLLLALLALAAAGAAGWAYFPKLRARFAPSPQVTASSVAEAFSPPPSTASLASKSAPPPLDLPKWMQAVEEGQALLAGGDSDGALRKFKDASEAGGSALAKSFIDQLKIATTQPPGPCKLQALSHPRLGYSASAGRPAVAPTSKGAVVAWTDDHEVAGHDHVYSVLVDDTGKPGGAPRDLTPEADYAVRPELLAVGDRVVLLFWDRGGRQPGVKVRWLDSDGRISGMSIDVAPSKTGFPWPAPAIDRLSDGSGFWVGWQANPDREGDDIFLRRLDAELLPQGSEVRATEYEPIKGKVAKAGAPSLALSPFNLFLAYPLERDRQSSIERMRLPLAGPELGGPGLTEKSVARGQHELGDSLVVSEDKVGGDYPAMACNKEACFLVWHEVDRGTADAALVDPTRGTVLWRKRFGTRGGHPAIALAESGLAEVAFYDSGRVRVASLSRDGMGAPTTFAKMAGDVPRPWIAAGRERGEWLVSWLDAEGGHPEPFLARLQCRN